MPGLMNYEIQYSYLGPFRIIYHRNETFMIFRPKDSIRSFDCAYARLRKNSRVINDRELGDNDL